MRLAALLLLLSGSSHAYGGKTAQEYLDSCLKGGTQDCNTLAYMTDDGIEVPQDHARAYDLYQISCNRGSIVACNYLGRVYEEGLAVPVDLPRAAKLYRKSCDGGKLSACVNWGVMLSQGRGVPRNVKKAVAIYKQICAMDPAEASDDNRKVIAGACHNLANLYDPGGDGVTQNLKQADRLFAKACDLGDADACNALRNLREHGVFKGTRVNKATHLGASGTR